MKKPKLYQELNRKQMTNFLSQYGTNLEVEPFIELHEGIGKLNGKFIVIGGYKIKCIYDDLFNCVETPTEKHKPMKISIPKAPNDHYPWRK